MFLLFLSCVEIKRTTFLSIYLPLFPILDLDLLRECVHHQRHLYHSCVYYTAESCHYAGLNPEPGTRGEIEHRLIH